VVLYLDFTQPNSTIARTIRNEKDGRKIFYGMMIEGVIAMVWAAAAMSLMSGEGLSTLLANEGLPGVVHKIATVF
jgi:carbon starvation protein CstA